MLLLLLPERSYCEVVNTVKVGVFVCVALLDDEDIVLPPRVTTTKSVVFSTTAFTPVKVDDHPKAKRLWRDIIIIIEYCLSTCQR